MIDSTFIETDISQNAKSACSLCGGDTPPDMTICDLCYLELGFGD